MERETGAREGLKGWLNPSKYWKIWYREISMAFNEINRSWSLGIFHWTYL